MNKQTKEQITRESCTAEILKSTRSSIKGDAILWGATAILFLPVTIGMLLSTKEALGIIVGLLALLPPAFFTYRLIYSHTLLNAIKRGELSIVKDRVVLVKKGNLRLYRDNHGRRTIDRIYFANHGSIIASDHLYALSDEGDEFYLAVLRKKKILRVYPTITYEYK